MNSFNLKKVKVQKQFNWRFWFKICCAILPLISIVVFLIAQGNELFNDTAKYWSTTLSKDTKYQDIADLISMSHSQMGAYLFCRNILMITTLGNILNASWFINSAINNRYEGQGKWDNRIWGTMCINTIIYIVLFYNLSLAVSHDILNHMHWYNWMSWMLEHIFPDTFMIIYFFVFYPKRDIKVSKKATARSEWWYEMLIGISFVVVCNIFFMILGYSLRAAKGTRVFGEMSYTGYFPYPFYNFLPENKQALDQGNSWIKPWVEFVAVMIIQVIEQIGVFAIIHYVSMKQIKTVKYKNINLEFAGRRAQSINK